MCDSEAGLDRREILTLAGGAGLALLLTGASTRPASATSGSPAALTTRTPIIRPRSDWASDIPPAVGLADEPEVKVLLVHHTATANGYSPDDVARQIASFHRYHTTTKGWPDVAYNFFVDAHGVIWEGRTGSLERPVAGDATGGNQGSSQLCCFIGDHTLQPPTPEAQASMVSLLAHLANRYQVDPSPGATATFTSRGSNRWPAGTEIAAATISGHRAMSQTSCPGDAAQALVDEEVPARVLALMGSSSAASTTEAVEPPEPASAEEPPSSTSSEPADPSEVSTSTIDDEPEAASTSTTTVVRPTTTLSRDASTEADPASFPTGLAVGGAGVTAVVAAALALRMRRQRPDPPDSEPGTSRAANSDPDRPAVEE